MSQRAENNYRLELYDDLDEIISAMRNLAQVELVRLDKARQRQQALFGTCQQAMANLQHHFPEQPPSPSSSSKAMLLVLGSERGFCGGFNEQVAQHFATLDPDQFGPVLVVGSRLANKLADHHSLSALPAAVSIDEALPVMQSITDNLIAQGLPRQLHVLYHDRSASQLIQLLPAVPLATAPAPQPATISPSLQINLKLEQLQQELQWQYLQQGLMLYLVTSLQTENRWRLQQMEGARDHLENLSLELRKRINSQRQQEIVEEIEVILSDQNHLL